MPALIAGLTTAGMATAAVVVVSTGSTGSTANPNSSPSADSGRQILLAAATTAEQQPATSGRYWHLKLVDDYKKPTSKPSRQVTESWVGHDGQRWYRAAGKVVHEVAESTYIPSVLIDLLYEDPTPPKVRAAAYRALAALPNVKNTGAVKGGRRLVINGGTAEEYRLVFDPKTSVVHSVSWGDVKSYNNFTILTAEWTNTLPK
jgi:hypothetical protein